MRNIDLATIKLEKLEGKLQNLYVMQDRPISKEDYNKILEDAKNIISDLKTMVQREALN
jgi:hypothetical protein